jgi:acyl-CoA reductase-like NAD-dependent aldehyde dehydrogenase
MKNFENFVNGKFVGSDDCRIEVKNPATGAVICTVPDSTQQDVDVAIASAETAQRSWEKETAARMWSRLPA